MAVMAMKSFGIKGIVPLSMLDWEGRLVTTIFLGGCNFRCPFCHNAQLVTGNSNLPEISWDDISETLISKRGWVDGVCITGGEPTISNKLIDLARHIVDLGFRVKLDTNGTQPQVLKELVDGLFISAVAVDIKTSFPKYPLATNVPDLSDRVKESIGIAIEAQNQRKLEVEFRTTVVPTIVEREDVLSIAEYLGKAGATRYTLQQFNPKTVLAQEAGNIRPFGQEILTELAQEASQFVPTHYRG
ncbi:MAG TPA: anaerobic ribonucleoside-triphosphate reductase activating protein [Anaerolineae bacterium]|jgi:pyruvate formate lyase activating enzyme|nr:anaerobic ribonucleoside-triphosphate reductase activating protein [Anaerolineae bacterium]